MTTNEVDKLGQQIRPAWCVCAVCGVSAAGPGGARDGVGGGVVARAHAVAVGRPHGVLGPVVAVRVHAELCGAREEWDR